MFKMFESIQKVDTLNKLNVFKMTQVMHKCWTVVSLGWSHIKTNGNLTLNIFGVA